MSRADWIPAQPGKHILAVSVEGVRYRDTEELSDNELEEILGKNYLPSQYVAFHWNCDEQWKEVLKLPIFRHRGEPTLAMQLRIDLSPYGECRKCRQQPADGLYKGRYPIINENTGSLVRTSLYRSYICEQCADNIAEESGVKGTWITPRARKVKS